MDIRNYNLKAIGYVYMVTGLVMEEDLFHAPRVFI